MLLRIITDILILQATTLKSISLLCSLFKLVRMPFRDLLLVELLDMDLSKMAIR